MECGTTGRSSENKCCAAISISKKWSGKDNYYLYRCMDRGLGEAKSEFSIRDDLDVKVMCHKGVEKSSSGATALAMTLASAAAVAALF